MRRGAGTASDVQRVRASAAAVTQIFVAAR